MVKVSFKGTNMFLSVKGIHKLLAFKSEIKVPIDQITSASTDPEGGLYPIGMRAPGTHVPGLIIAGTYRAQGKKVFWDVCNKRKAIVIDLKNSAYDRLVVEVDDPPETVDRIRNRLEN